ncbi:TatD family hydrolase [Candidatus Daviesbacteria bacterium]|nr:TatD family hydrolase [Candidatus Daviesbacteria bacterium]
MLIDTHAHLFWDSYKEDFDEVLQRANELGIITIINVGVDTNLSEQALKQAEEIKQLAVYSTIGIHPHEAVKYHKNPDQLIQLDIDQLEEIYHQSPTKVVAVGECGLDYLFPSSAVATGGKESNLPLDQIKNLQRQLFKAQINLANKLDLPLLVHCRDDRSKIANNIECWLEVLDMVKNSKGILHCYSGMPEVTAKALSLDFLISFAGNLTYPKNDYLKEAAKTIPLEKIALETDSPFLPPQSQRGQRNEPSFILETAQVLAELKSITKQKLAEQTSLNVKALLKLS